MSDMEYHRGTARKYDRLPNETDIEYARRYAKYKGLPFSEDAAMEFAVDGLSSIFCELELSGPWRNQTALISNDDVIWELIEHVYSEYPENMNNATKNADGTVSFIYGFYNGGTCLDECFSNSIDKISSASNEMISDG